MDNRIKTFYKLNPWKGRFILSFITIAIILCIVRLALPPTIIYSATSWLKDRQIDSSIEEININILDGTVSLVNAIGSRDGDPLFNIGLIDIHWHWAPLSEKTIVVTKVVLDNLSVDIEQYSDELVISGVHIPLTDEKKTDETTNKDVQPWSASLGEVVFTNLDICYLQNSGIQAKVDQELTSINYCLELDEMNWGGTISYATDPKIVSSSDLILSSTGNFKLNGLTVTDNKLNKILLSSNSNTIENVVFTGHNDMHIDRLVMNNFSALQRDDAKHKDTVRFQQLTVDDISLTNLNLLSINAIKIKNPGLYLIKLNNADWEYQQWLPNSTQTAEIKSGETNQSFTATINNINIDDSDFCYLEKNKKLDYCFTQENLSWNGSIQSTTASGKSPITIRGDLLLNNTNIINRELNRDLIDIKTVSLKGVAVDDIDKASLTKLTINNLFALQRSKTNTDATVAFTELALNKTNYNNNSIVIDSINLEGLSNTVSKNKNGEWEHDKWLTGVQKKEDNGTKNKQNNSKKPILVSIRSAKIRTNKDISFIDNSTKPAMKVGLKKLEFNIDKLLSDKPESKSPFKLFAKTTRHSTIDISGTVQPFSEKVSFDAKGKLKGFDLRAATPATKKAIGHIIKSGQLDADLEILAEDGQLDSNIGLSLYQFHIKPMSDEDAKKLDTELGMPLNKTLVLLRDKDDSIHLDIPITGDINNPDFSPMHAIVKATTKAATVTLITFYTPYGLIYAGGSVLLDLASALNFDPIVFAPGSSKLTADNSGQLDNLAKLLKEKTQVHLTLCGSTNREDSYTLYPGLKKPVEKDKPEAPIVLSKKQETALNKLATDRQTTSKNYLIKTAEITHDRIILCEPEHLTDKDAFAGVDINI